MGPQPNNVATIAPKDVKRTEESPEPLALKVPDLASLPENQQSPPSPVRPEAGPLERAAKTAAIEIPKSGPTPKPQPRVPTLPERELTASSSADANVKRQAVDAGSGKRGTGRRIVASNGEASANVGASSSRTNSDGASIARGRKQFGRTAPRKTTAGTGDDGISGIVPLAKARKGSSRSSGS